MFSALKKLTASAPVPTTSSTNGHQQPPNGASAMSDSLQRKFARGVQYNMKIIIKGDRNVGKTCLLHRLQGQPFIDAYRPSDEIQVASIQWSFKPSETDIVKVEVWDVVDRGKARSARPPPGTGRLKLSNPALVEQQPALDAEFLDVYKGTHGVVLLMDITKAWTFEYVVRELPRIPQDIPVLILGNHCDMAHHRVISAGQVIGLIEEHADRPAEIHYGDSSMRNGFGLRLLHRFLGLPFLRLQRETLLSQLQRNQHETLRCSGDLAAFLQSDEADYGKFIDQLSTRRRQIADANPKTLAAGGSLAHSASNSSVSSAASATNATDVRSPFGKSIIVGGGQPIVVPGQLNTTNEPRTRPADSVGAAGAPLPPSSVRSTAGFMTHLLGSPAATTCVLNVDEFCPDGGNGLDRGFLDDEPATGPAMPAALDSDSDEDAHTGTAGGNPLVARFHDEQPGQPDDSPAHQLHASSVRVPKVNPLAKNTAGQRASTTASDEADAELDRSIGALRIAHSPSGLDDDQRRRSPEGLEDPIAAMLAGGALACHQRCVAPLPVEQDEQDGQGDDDEPKASSRSARKAKKERHETKAERHARRAEKKSKRRSKELASETNDDDSAAIDATAYEAL